jgi:hypothetical protein
MLKRADLTKQQLASKDRHVQQLAEVRTDVQHRCVCVCTFHCYAATTACTCCIVQYVRTVYCCKVVLKGAVSMHVSVSAVHARKELHCKAHTSSFESLKCY